jgi:hypothetical protein
VHEFNTNPASIERRGRGRPKGSKNVISRNAKDVIQGVADKLGGMEAMFLWVNEDPLNKRAFYTNIFPKLIPVTVAGDDKHPLSVIVRKVIDPIA